MYTRYPHVDIITNEPSLHLQTYGRSPEDSQNPPPRLSGAPFPSSPGPSDRHHAPRGSLLPSLAHPTNSVIFPVRSSLASFPFPSCQMLISLPSLPLDFLLRIAQNVVGRWTAEPSQSIQFYPNAQSFNDVVICRTSHSM